MGKLKNALIVADEIARNAVEQSIHNREIFDRIKPATRDQWVSYGIANDQDWAQYEAEFNAWLDNYEKSFGQGGSHD